MVKELPFHMQFALFQNQENKQYDTGLVSFISQGLQGRGRPT